MIYLVIPKLIKGSRPNSQTIGKVKGLSKSLDANIYRSTEFYKDMYVVPVSSVENVSPEKLPYILAENEDDEGKLINKVKDIVKLSEVDPKEVFGTRIEPGFQVNFVQEFGTPYQLFPKTDSKTLSARPEAWYTFGPAKLTLGVKEDIKIDEYRQACVDIYALTQSVSKEIKSKKITPSDARKKIEDIIEVLRPDKFVNRLPVKVNTIVDMSKGGINCSIEEDHTLPEGVMLFEVSKEVPIKKSILGAYDNGRIEDDGSYTQLQISEYFENIDDNIVDNNPKNRIKTFLKLKDLNNWKLNKIFNTSHFQTDELILFKEYKIEELGFRHLFVREGTGILKADDIKLNLIQGHSYILPSTVKTVAIKNTTPKEKGEEESKLRLLLTYKREHLKK